jgi:hypothetical protein
LGGEQAVLLQVVLDPPPTANTLSSALAALNVVMGEHDTDWHIWLLDQVLAGDVALTDEEGPTVKASRSRKGNHSIGIVLGIEWRGCTCGHCNLSSDCPWCKVGIKNGASPA